MSWARHPYLLLVPLVPLVQMRVDRSLGEYRAQEAVLYLWTGEQVRRLSPGLEGLMADIYWLRTVQYYGGQRAFALEKRFDLLRPLVEITTTLDPRFEIAYRYGATFLSEPWPIGAGDPRAGVAVLEKGVKALPASWRLRQDLSFFIFMFLHDSKRSAEVLVEASRIPGAPYWLTTLAADLLTKGGERELSRRIWRQMYEQAEGGAIKSNALVHLQRLDALDAAEELTHRAHALRAERGRLPSSLHELQAFSQVPTVDPTGVAYDYDPDTGTVSVSRKSVLWTPSERGASSP